MSAGMFPPFGLHGGQIVALPSGTILNLSKIVGVVRQAGQCQVRPETGEPFAIPAEDAEALAAMFPRPPRQTQAR